VYLFIHERKTPLESPWYKLKIVLEERVFGCEIDPFVLEQGPLASSSKEITIFWFNAGL